MATVRVKVCGVTTPGDVRLAAALGADAVGVNFHPPSPRYVDPREAPRLLREVPPFVVPVGVFVGLPMRRVCALAYQLGLRCVQWVGESPEAGDPFPFALLPAFRVRDRESLREITRYLGACRQAGWSPGAVLVDAFVEGQMGGTGRTAPWELLADFDPGVPLVLAGGLTPENVGAAVRRVRPAAVDVASGVESAPGRKDPEKLRRFIAAAREAAAALS
ncbi:MAG TPA: phosphoribosylanthranilate isomerase [Gemmataceae bacterium]